MRVGNEYSNSFDVWVGVHQGSVSSPLLFVIVLEVISMEFRAGCLWEILYVDDLMVSAQSMDELSEVENMEVADGVKGVEGKFG